MSFNLTYSTLTSLEIDKIECKYKTTFKLLILSIMKCLPEGQHIVHHQFDVYSLKSSCVVSFRTFHMLIYSFEQGI